MLLKDTQGHDVECAQVGGRQVDFWGTTFVMGLQETRGAEAPGVAWFEACKVEFWLRCGEIVADVFRVCEKLCGHDSADRVAALIFGTGVAGAVTKKAGQRIGGAGGKRVAEYVYGSVFFYHAQSFA